MCYPANDDDTASLPENTAERAAVEKILENLVPLCSSNPAEAEILASETIVRAQKLNEPAFVGTLYCLLSRAISLLRDSSETIELASRAVEVLRPLDEKARLATALNNLGNCYRRMAEPLDSIRCFEEALEIQESIGNKRGIAVVQNNLGLAFRNIASYDRAYASFMRAVELSEEINNTLLKTTALSNIADILIDQGDFKSAEQYLKASLKIYRETFNRIGEAFCLWEMGRLKQKQNQTENAEKYLRESIALRKDLGSSKIGESLFTLAELLENDNRSQEAEAILQDAIDHFEEKDDSSDLSMIKARLAILRIHIDKLNGVEKPLEDFLMLLSGSDGSSDRNIRTQVLKALSEYHEKLNNMPTALDFIRRYSEEKIELLEQTQRKNISMLKLKADYERSEDARLLLEKKAKELEQLNKKLQVALYKIKSLHGMLPICARCKKIRQDNGYWEQIEHYISNHSDATFSHGLCPDCMRELYPDHYSLKENAE